MEVMYHDEALQCFAFLIITSILPLKGNAFDFITDENEKQNDVDNDEDEGYEETSHLLSSQSSKGLYMQRKQTYTDSNSPIVRISFGSFVVKRHG